MSLLTYTNRGIYCEAGAFYIDPTHQVDKAIVTHAHSDHSRRGMKAYLAHHDSIPIMKHRLGQNIHAQGLAYGEEISMNGVKVSLHPAGHITGSAQVRVEYRGEVWVVTGDFKTAEDPTCERFEPVPSSHFIMETTFGLPIFKWQDDAVIFKQIHAWWEENRKAGLLSVILCYSLGKAQRLLHGLDVNQGPVYVQPEIETINRICRGNGMKLPATQLLNEGEPEEGAIILASSLDQIKCTRPLISAMASGWLAVKALRGRYHSDTGFVLSDHADWPGLLSAVEATGAEHVYTMHGYTETFARYLREQQGIDAKELKYLVN